MNLRAIRRRFLRVERDVKELQEDVGEPFEAEKESVMKRLRALEDAARARSDETKSGK